ncbi:MAG: DUF3696 domain-containing protein [Desulfovibrio sp.]|nr:DUF3696 domain-containing protein [Desulfovibrio sp.]
MLLGKKGTGKSALIDTILFLNSIKCSESNDIIPLNLNEIDLGTAQDILYQYATFDTLTLGLESDVGMHLLDFQCDAQKDYVKPVGFDKSSTIEIIFKHIPAVYYLAASRVYPQTLHLKSRSGIEKYRFGIHGEHAVFFLAQHGADDINNEALKHPKSNTTTLKDQANAWMGEISPGIRLNAEEIKGADAVKLDMQYLQPSRGYTNRFKPTHVGLGISYSLPVVMALLTSKPGEILLIDSPESNLHPSAQVAIGRLASLAAASGVQVILETHSDHIVNSVRVACKENCIASNNVALFYFDRETTKREQYAHIHDIDIDSNGELSDYPDNLLTEWSSQLLKLM